MHKTYLFQFSFRNPANAVCAEIRIPSLDAAKAAQILVPLLLPLRNQVLVGHVLVQAVFVQFATDRLSAVEQVVDVPRLLVVYFEYRPQRLLLTLAFVRLSLSYKTNTKVSLKCLNLWLKLKGVPSRIFCSSSSSVGSINSQPSGGAFLLLLTLGILTVITISNPKHKQNFFYRLGVMSMETSNTTNLTLQKKNPPGFTGNLCCLVFLKMCHVGSTGCKSPLLYCVR